MATVQSMTMLEIHENESSKLDSSTSYGVDNDFIRKAIDQADTNTLRIALCQITKDKRLESMRVTKIDIRRGAIIDYILSEQDQRIVREKALEYLLKGPHYLPPPPSKEEAFKLMDLYNNYPTTSKNENNAHHEEGFEELSFPKFPREVKWAGGNPPPEKIAQYKVVIIGSGISGIAAAIPLKRLGIPFVIVERQADIGGTWLSNNYPNVRVDSPSTLYQYSFTKDYRWKELFPTGRSIQEYLEYVVTKYDIKKNMHFNREVVKAKWDESSSKWNMTIKHKDGVEETLSCNFIISCSGLFSTPSLPDIEGITSYKRPIFNTSQWDHGIDYHKKDIALIGTGSSGTQVAPALAREAKHLTVYQRTPNWIAPFRIFGILVPDHTNWLYQNMPFYWNWTRYSSFMKSLNFQTLQVYDNSWREKGGIISKRNDDVRKALTEHIHDHFKDRPDLVSKLLPKQAPSVRRMVLDNGFYDTLLQDNVSLITSKIERITEKGILTKDGVEREFDIIILGAGFKVSQYLYPVDYIGTQGMTLQKAWKKDGARSYLGMTMPNYPNLFTLYGPNHQPRGGSLHSACEIWARYAVSSIVGIIERDAKSMELKREVFEEYNVRLDEQNKKNIWEEEGAGYFVNGFGRQQVNNPFRNDEYFRMVRKVNFEDYVVR